MYNENNMPTYDIVFCMYCITAKVEIENTFIAV